MSFMSKAKNSIRVVSLAALLTIGGVAGSAFAETQANGGVLSVGVNLLSNGNSKAISSGQLAAISINALSTGGQAKGTGGLIGISGNILSSRGSATGTGGLAGAGLNILQAVVLRKVPAV